MKQNKMGFTLVEIIVSIAIASVVLMIAGGMILSSSNFMMTTTEMDINKRATDSIIDFVRGEIIYSTDVRFVPVDSKYVPDYENDDNWHYMYIKDGELYRDGVRIFDTNFTNHNKLNIQLKGSGSSETNHRLDIKYSLLDYKKESVYSSRDTVMFLNLSISDEILHQGLYTSEYIELSNNGYWLYYTKKLNQQLTIPDSSDHVSTGTVADQIDFKTMENNRGKWDSSLSDHMIIKNDFVFHDGYWWMLVYHSGGTGPSSVIKVPGGTELWWKCIDSQFHNNSAYELGDIIMYNNIYYECILSTTPNLGVSLQTPDKDTERWRKVSNQENVPNMDGKHNINIYNDARQKQTIVKKLDNIDLSKIPATNNLLKMSDEEINKIPKVNDKDKPQINEIYYKVIDRTDNSSFVNDTRFQYVQYFIKLFDDTSTGITTKKYVWQELCVDFKNTSAYMTDDIVLYNTMDILFMKAINNIDNDTNPQLDVYNNKNWKKVNL